MATVLKVIGQATLGSTQNNNDLLTIYSGLTPAFAVPTGKALLVKNVRFVNKDASTKRTATLNYFPGGGSPGNPRAISPSNFSLVPGGAVVIDDEFVLVATDALRVSFGEAGLSIIDVVVTGIERDQS